MVTCIVNEKFLKTADDQPKPMRIRAEEPLTLLSTGKKRIEYKIEGGVPPYNVELRPNWGIFSTVIGQPDSKTNKLVYELEAKNDKATVSFNVRDLLQRLSAEQRSWLPFTAQMITRANDNKQRTADIIKYRNLANEDLDGIIKAKLKGVPIAFNMTVLVTDSNQESAPVTHCIVIDVPTDQFLKMFETK